MEALRTLIFGSEGEAQAEIDRRGLGREAEPFDAKSTQWSIVHREWSRGGHLAPHLLCSDGKFHEHA